MTKLSLSSMSNGDHIYWHHKKRKHSQQGYHFQDFYEILLVLGGSAVNCINDINHGISVKDVIFMNKNIKHEILCLNQESLKYINIAFDDMIMERIIAIFPDFIIPKSYLKKNLEQNKIDNLINIYTNININLSYREASKEIELFTYHIIKELLFVDDISSKMYPGWFDTLISVDVVRGGVSLIFKESPYSKQHTIKKFKEFIALTPSEYVNICRIYHAAKLLQNTSKSVTDICYESGFSNLEYFDKVFKKRAGMSPSKYRKSTKTVTVESYK